MTGLLQTDETMKRILWVTYIIFFLFVIYYGVFASRTFDGAIKHSYDKGMEYPAKIARLKELGWEFTGGSDKVVAGQATAFFLTISDRQGNPVTDARVVMQVSRPASPETLAAVEAKLRENGRYESEITVPAYGHWLVSIKIDRLEDEFDYEYRVYASKGGVNAN